MKKFNTFLNDHITYSPRSTHTSMTGGKYYIHKQDKRKFYFLYEKAIREGGEYYIAEQIHPIYNSKWNPNSHTELNHLFQYVKSCFDFDDIPNKRVNEITKEWKKLTVEYHNIDEKDVKIVTQCNNNNSSKKHVWLFHKGVPLCYNFRFKEYFEKKFPEVDKITGLRLPYSLKPKASKESYYSVDKGTDWCYFYPMFFKEEWLIVLSAKGDDALSNYKNQVKKQIGKNKNKDETRPFNNEDIEEKISFCLPLLVEYMVPYHGWMNVVWICKSCNYPLDKIDEFCSENYDGYEPDSCEKIYNNYKPGKLGFGSMIYYLNDEAKKLYNDKFVTYSSDGDFIPHSLASLVYKGESGLADAYIFIKKDYFKVCTKKLAYLWNPKTKLWEKTEDLIVDIEDTLSTLLLKIKSKLVLDEKEEETRDKSIAQQKVISSILRKVRTLNTTANIWGWIYRKVMETSFQGVVDSSPYFLPIKDGNKINLKTGEVSERTVIDCFSKELKVIIGDAKRKEIVSFFEDLLPDEQIREYFRKILGYSLCGNNKEKKIFLIWGPRDNGKSALFNLMRILLGDFYTTLDSSSVLKNRTEDRHNGRATPEIVPLVGKRMGVCNDIGEESLLNDILLKQISGGDEIPCRPLYGEFFMFEPTSKLFMVSNFHLEFNSRDKAFCERISYIPFTTIFCDNPTLSHERKKNPEIIDKIRKKYMNDFFAWIMKGSIDYHKEGLKMPPILETEKEELIVEQDDLGEFLKLNLKQSPGNVLLMNVCRRYRDYCTENELRFISNKSIGSTIENYGYKKKKTNKGLVLINVEFVEDNFFKNEEK